VAARIAIFGSCVTRDALNLQTPHLQLVSYHARISPVSVVSPPLPLSAEELHMIGGFKRRMLLADFNKTVFEDLRTARPEIIVFDFAESFDLLRHGRAFVTLSTDLATSGFDYAARYEFEQIRNYTSRAVTLWRSASRDFAGRLRSMFPHARFVLHKAYWARDFREGTDLVPFDRQTQLGITLQNLTLDSYYAHFIRQFETLDVVEVPRPHHAASNHRWGLSPLHFEDSYRRQLLTRLEQIAGSTRPT
jgi:hypothetical protein